MLTNLLWYLEAKQQHDGQRAAGLSGLVFLILTFLAVWKWNDWIYPVLKWTGLVGMADRIGLITDSIHTTMLNVVLMIVLLVFTYAILSFVMVFLGLFISTFLASNTGGNVIAFILAPFLFIPILIYARHMHKKQNAPKKETSSEKFMREYHEKEKAKYDAWLEKFENAPNTTDDMYKGFTKEMLGYNRSLWSGIVGKPDGLDEELTHFYQWGEYVRNIEPQLDPYRDNVIVFNKETCKFSVLLPNPLPVMVSDLYNKSFEDEEVLLEVLQRYKEEFPLSDQHVFPSLELETINTQDYTYLAPVENAQIKSIKVVDGDSNFEKYHLKEQLNFYRTIEKLNERKDVQALLDRVNLNTLILHDIVQKASIKSKPKPDVLGVFWGNVESYKELFSAQLTAAMQKLHNQGYNWR